MPATPSIPVDPHQVLRHAELPALPQSAVRLLDLSRDPENGPPEFAIPIESDPGMAGQVLRFVNSSYFGFSREISSVRQALALVGIRTINNFVLWSAVFSTVPDPKCGAFALQRVWRDSLRRAVFARTLARQLQLDDCDGPFTAALLQDVALPLLVRAVREPYARLLEQIDHSTTRLSELEHEAFGWTHAAVSGMLCRHWNLPDPFAVMVENHTEVEFGLARLDSDPMPALVAVSALLPGTHDETWPQRDLFGETLQRIVPTTDSQLSRLFQDTDRQFVELAPMLKLPANQRLLESQYSEHEQTTAHA